MKAIFTSAVPCQRTTVTPTSFVTDTNTTPCCTLRRSLSFRIRQKPWEEQEGLRKIAQRYRRKTCVFPKSKHFLKGPFAGQQPQLPAHTLLGRTTSTLHALPLPNRKLTLHPQIKGRETKLCSSPRPPAHETTPRTPPLQPGAAPLPRANHGFSRCAPAWQRAAPRCWAPGRPQRRS